MFDCRTSRRGIVALRFAALQSVNRTKRVNVLLWETCIALMKKTIKGSAFSLFTIIVSGFQSNTDKMSSKSKTLSKHDAEFEQLRTREYTYNSLYGGMGSMQKLTHIPTNTEAVKLGYSPSRTAGPGPINLSIWKGTEVEVQPTTFESIEKANEFLRRFIEGKSPQKPSKG